MKIEKKGLIYAPDRNSTWRWYYSMMPTPIHIPEKKCIRVYFGITDSNRFGRVTYIDLDDQNPTKIIQYPNQIQLDLGVEGTFDDSGVVPSSILLEEDHVKLYYVGFQRSYKVPFTLFSGLSISKTLDFPFERYSFSPIIERSKASPYSNAAPFVIKDDFLYKMWFWEGENWVVLSGKKYIQAVISYAESIDGISWNIIKRGCLKPALYKEFSLGRPWVVKHQDVFKMFYSVRYLDKLYRLGYAESFDGVNWERKDEEIGIDVSAEGWDSEMICYPSVITVKDKTFLFYNGNNNGETGFGYAELIEW